MKLTNGYGSVSKVKGKRRKPYRVYVTTGWTDEGKQIKKSLGYVATQKEGLMLLAQYHNDPYNLDYKNLTFTDVWKDVEKELEDLVKQRKMSESNLKCLSLAYKNHCKTFWKEKLLELKYIKMQVVIDNLELGRTGKGYVKTVCVKIFNCAIDKYELPIKNNPAIRLNVGEREDSNKHIPFTEDELNALWQHSDDNIVKTILIFCYSGMRPNELFEISIDEIYLNNNYMRGGSKTKAGRDRIIPIHPKIKPFIEEFTITGNNYPFKTIIGEFNYQKYTRRVKEIMKQFNMSHTPYDGRHTFITRMKKAKADDYLLKRIIGHSIQDITEKVYTHREIEELINEILKIN